MRKLFYVFVLGVVTVMVVPSCSTSDSLDDVIDESNFDVASSTNDAESKVAKPGSN